MLPLYQVAFDNTFFKQRPAVVPQIYGYRVPGLPSHNGFIKVGYTGRPDVNIRIGEQVGTIGVNYELVLTESAMRPDGSCFLDTMEIFVISWFVILGKTGNVFIVALVRLLMTVQMN